MVLIMLFVLVCSHAITNYNIKYLSTENGLTNNYVTSVCQDNFGFIWFGTRDGLNRWDGCNIKTFRHQPQDTNSLPDNFIRTLTSDGNGNLWIGTNQAGAVRYNIKDERFFSYPIHKTNETSFPDYYARCSFKQNDSTIWFGTNNGLAKYNPATDSFKRIRLQEKQSDNTEIIISIFKIDEESVGIQSNLGLFKISNSTVQNYELPKSFPKLKTLHENNPIFVASNGDIWFADPDTLFHYEKENNVLNRYLSQSNEASTLTSNDISGIMEDSKGNLWISTWDGGANLFNTSTKKITRFNDRDEQAFKLSDNIVTGIFEDSNENIWLTTEEGGINYISLKENWIQFFSHNAFDQNSLINNKIGSFYCSPDGSIYVGTGSAVMDEFHPDVQNFKHHKVLKNNLNATITGITAINETEFYIAGWGLGLHQFNKETGQSRNVLKGIPGLDYNKTVYENIRSITVDKKGNIWLAIHSDAGLAIFNPKKNMVYNAENPGPINRQIISVPFPGSVLIDSMDRIWVTSYTGLYMYDGKDFYEFKESEESDLQISSNYVYSIYEDSNHHIWVGSSVGLDKISFKDEKIIIEKQSAIQPNIPGNIKSIIGDTNQCLWLSSSNGLIRYNTENKEVRVFQIKRNVPVLEFSERACDITKSGKILFGTTQGFLFFHPNNMVHNSDLEPIYFTDLRIYNQSQKVGEKGSVLEKSILSTDTVYLAHHQNVIGIEFTPLQLNSHEGATYEYKLTGVDKDWVTAGNNRLITYANISHGSYEFLVRKRQGSGSEEVLAKRLTLIISPPFWQTKLAYFTYAVLFLFALYIFRKAILNREKLKNALTLQKLKIQNVEETNLMKLRFFTNISHEFRTPLTLIKVPLEKLIKNYKSLSPEEQFYQYELMLNSTNRLDKMVTQLMDYRKMEAGSLVLESAVGNLIEFCNKIFDNFQLLAQQKQLKFLFSSDVQSIIMAFDADKLEKVLSNILSNAFKNTPSNGKIILSISQEHQDVVAIKVSDTGMGISNEDLPHIFERFYMVQSTKGVQGTGIGLALAKELIEIHQGEISVESIEKRGTTFTIKIPTTILATKSEQREDESDKDDLEYVSLVEKKHGNKLLVIDDDTDMLAYLKHELSTEFDVVTAINGEEGLQLADKEKPNLIISDIMMPLLDGIELCEALKRNELTSHIPIILLSARHSDEAKIEGLGSGANAYLMKPFNQEVLLLTINNILNSRKQLFERFKSDASFFFESNDIESSDQKLIQGIIDLVLENITNNKINAEFIAKRVFISRTVLYTKIEALTGQTVNEFIAHIRLKKAKQFLLNPDINISEVSYKVGYASQSYFSRSFAKAFGYSPSEFISRNT